MPELELNFIWESNVRAGYMHMHQHTCTELVYYRSGLGLTDIDDHTYAFEKGTFAIVPAGMLHDERRNEECVILCLGVDGDFCSEPCFLTDHSGEILKILRSLAREARIQSYGYQEMLRIKLNELYIHLQRTKERAPEEKNFEYIIHHIREHSHEKILLAECADQLCISYDYFQHKFKKFTGLSPQQFLIRTRLEKAKALLDEGALNCTEISFQCGFSTSAQFSNLFKRAYGVSPIQYRKKIRQ